MLMTANSPLTDRQWASIHKGSSPPSATCIWCRIMQPPSYLHSFLPSSTPLWLLLFLFCYFSSLVGRLRILIPTFLPPRICISNPFTRSQDHRDPVIPAQRTVKDRYHMKDECASLFIFNK